MAIVKLSFGKYKNKRLSKIPTDYLEWCRDKCDSLTDDVRRRGRGGTGRACGEAAEAKAEPAPDKGEAPAARAPRVSPLGQTLMGEVRMMYRNLALKYHPDRGGSAEAMKALNEFHETLQELLTRTFHRPLKPWPATAPQEQPPLHNQWAATDGAVGEATALPHPEKHTNFHTDNNLDVKLLEGPQPGGRSRHVSCFFFPSLAKLVPSSTPTRSHHGESGPFRVRTHLADSERSMRYLLVPFLCIAAGAYLAFTDGEGGAELSVSAGTAPILRGMRSSPSSGRERHWSPLPFASAVFARAWRR